MTDRTSAPLMRPLLLALALPLAAGAQQAAVRAHHPEAPASSSRSRQVAKQLRGNELDRAHHTGAGSRSHKTYSDLRVSVRKPAPRRLRPPPRVALTPSRPDAPPVDTARVVLASGGEVLPAPVATVGSPVRWPWLLLPLGLGVVAVDRHHGGETEAPVPAGTPSAPRTTVPEPGTWALAAAGLGITYARRTRHRA